MLRSPHIWITHLDGIHTKMNASENGITPGVISPLLLSQSL